MPSISQPQKHPLTVEGYEDSLQLLAERVHRMRYDKTAEFYKYSIRELQRQATGDQGRNRIQLATLLNEATRLAEEQEKLFTRIYKLCQPHMEE